MKTTEALQYEHAVAIERLERQIASLEEQHQAMTAERDDWRTYAREAGAQKEQAQIEINKMTDKLEGAVHAFDDMRQQRDRLAYLVKLTYRIEESDGSLRQALMDNLIADVAKDVLDGLS